MGNGLVGGGDAAAEVLGDAQGLGGCFVHAQDVTKLQWGRGMTHLQKGSMFSRRLPANMAGSWGTMLSWLRSASRSARSVFLSLSTIEPPQGWMRRKSATAKGR